MLRGPITQNIQSATFQYDELGRMSQRLLPNGVSTEWGFNTAGFLTSVISKRSGAAFDSHTLVPDAVGNILQESINGAPANTFGYDDLYRLTSSSVGGVASSWLYDNNGNRTSQTVGGVTTSYTPDDANRLIAVNGVTVTNDANGNATGDGSKTYSWDVRGRLVGMTGPGLTASFASDFVGRRVSKTINGATTTFLNDGQDLVTDTTGGVANQTLQGPAVDGPLARDGLFFTPNHLGSTTTLTDMSGVVQQSYSYSPFGETTGSGSVTNPFQFTGRENDGTGLMYYRARYYRPDWGRFVSEDPIGVLGGINRYAYAGNNPISYIDPLGLDAFNGLATYFAGWGDALTFGGTGRIRQWLGVDGVVDYGSGAYRAGSYTGIANGLALGAAGAARLVGARLAAAGATTVAANPQTYLRLIGEGEKAAIEQAQGAVASTGCKFPDATRVFPPSSWQVMSNFAVVANNDAPGTYTHVVAFHVSNPVPPLAVDVPIMVTVQVGQLT